MPAHVGRMLSDQLAAVHLALVELARLLLWAAEAAIRDLRAALLALMAAEREAGARAGFHAVPGPTIEPVGPALGPPGADRAATRPWAAHGPPPRLRSDAGRLTTSRRAL